MLTIGALAWTRGVLPPRPAALDTAVAGVLEVLATIFVLFAVQLGPVAVAAVVIGLYPGVTAGLARIFLGERLAWHQVFGIFMALGRDGIALALAEEASVATDDQPRMGRIEDHFDEEAPVYDDVIEKIIPGYAEQNRVLLEALAIPPGSTRVADLGIGTGQLADLVLQRYPDATVVGLDLSQGMLDQAATNLRRFGDRIELVRADLADIAVDGGFHAVIAGLSIHHLDDAGKQVLFTRVFEALEPGGMFLIRDVVLG